jgi:hypothetical protein
LTPRQRTVAILDTVDGRYEQYQIDTWALEFLADISKVATLTQREERALRNLELNVFGGRDF